MRALLLCLASACSIPSDAPQQVADHGRSISIAGASTLLLVEPTMDQPETLRAFGEEVRPWPVDVPSPVDIARGARHACSLSTTGTVDCWGDHSRGALGEQRTCFEPDCELAPEMMARLPPARAIAAGEDVTCAITLDDRVVCWGDRDLRGGSRLPTEGAAIPVSVDGALLAAERLIIHDRTVCAIATDGALWCWGDVSRLPARQPETGVLDLAFGAGHRCVIDGTGLRCAGNNDEGQLDVDPALDARRVVVGARHTCVLTRSSTVICFGADDRGQLGRADAAIDVVLDRVTELDTGDDHACARLLDDTVQCWGDFGTEVVLASPP